jgi:hypothetical protein
MQLAKRLTNVIPMDLIQILNVLTSITKSHIITKQRIVIARIRFTLRKNMILTVPAIFYTKILIINQTPNAVVTTIIIILIFRMPLN